MIAPLEMLEPRQLLTNLVAVHVNGNSLHLTELRGGQPSDEVDFSVAYTSSQVTLNSTGDTSFQVNGQTETTDTINISGPASISVQLNRHANVVSISGDGSANLDDLNLRLSAGHQSSSLTLNEVIANRVNITGRRSDDNVTFNNSTINGNLNANLGASTGDVLDLESTMVKGNVRDHVGALTMNQSTIAGTLHNVENGKNSTLDSTDTIYEGDTSIRMGPNGVINWHNSDSGANIFQSSLSIVGSPHGEATVNADPQSVMYDVTPTSRHTTFNTTDAPIPSSSPSTLGTPTVNSQTITVNTAPIITGTFDSVNTTVLTVAANGGTFTLGSSPQLTSPSTGVWSLNLGGAALTSPVTTVTVTSRDKAGNMTTGSGTITDGAGVISNFLNANKLTASTTADGLAIVTETEGTGAIPTKGQTISVNYSGFLLNANATQGTEFDSNTDAQFGHVTPFTFKLGAGQVIAGWDEAFALLPVGTVAKLIIPSALAYGTAGHGTSVPPNSILIFNVTVLSAT